MLQEIRHQQDEVKCLIALAPFLHLVRKIGQNCMPDLRWQSSAVMVLREASEMYLIGYLHDTNLAAIYAKCVTIMPKDMHLVKLLRTPLYGGRQWFQ